MPEQRPTMKKEDRDKLFRTLSDASRRKLAKGSDGEGADPVLVEMRKNRKVAMQRMGSSPRGGGLGGGGGNVSFATGRPRDPLFYWKQNNMPYDIWQEEQLTQIRAMCRLIYLTHPVMASAIDIFSKYPLTGMEFTCKDPKIRDFHHELFFEQLDYEDYLVDVGREYWIVGEAWPYGTFNEMLGVWEDDELLNPDDIDVIRSPFLRNPRFEMSLPATIKDILSKREPLWEYQRLISEYPEFTKFMHHDVKMPVSNILLKQLRFKGSTFHPRGVPIMMRGIRSLMQEESLNAAQDAISDRLYTPLILAKLGASAQDLGTDIPWIPDDGDLADFEESLDAALSADFRVIVHNFAVDMQNVFGRESMPNLSNDFDRLTDRQLQVFGLSRTMLMGASGGQTYAADALNRDLVTQLLSSYQKLIKRLYRDRALVVAEAQEHFDYEVRSGRRYPIMEEVLEIDEESGEQRIVEQPKLLIPDLQIRAMNLHDENDFHTFVESLNESGVPISMKTRLINIPIQLEDELEAKRQEAIDLAVWKAETEREVYLALKARGLPIDPELEARFTPVANNAEESVEAQMMMAEQQMLDPSLSNPSGDDLSSDGEESGGDESGGGSVIALPRNQVSQRPEESDEMRASMPKASLRAMTTEQINALDTDDLRIGKYTGGVTGGPTTVGMRRTAHVAANVPLDDEESA